MKRKWVTDGKPAQFGHPNGALEAVSDLMHSGDVAYALQLGQQAGIAQALRDGEMMALGLPIKITVEWPEGTSEEHLQMFREMAAAQVKRYNEALAKVTP